MDRFKFVELTRCCEMASKSPRPTIGMSSHRVMTSPDKMPRLLPSPLLRGHNALSSPRPQRQSEGDTGNHHGGGVSCAHGGCHHCRRVPCHDCCVGPLPL